MPDLGLEPESTGSQASALSPAKEEALDSNLAFFIFRVTLSETLAN